MLKMILTPVVVFGFTLSCANEADFGSTQDAGASAISSIEDGDAKAIQQEAAGAEACRSGDSAISLTKPQQDCIDSGKLWHFPNKRDPNAYCSNLNAASSYSCDKTGFTNFAEDSGVSTSVLTDRLDAGAKIVSCGEHSAGGSTFAMAQFIKAEDVGTCGQRQNVLTACFVPTSTSCDKSADDYYDCVVQWCFDQAK